MNKNKGFTLIELLLITVIIGILATISLGVYRAYIQDSDAIQRVVMAKNISQLLIANSAIVSDTSQPYDLNKAEVLQLMSDVYLTINTDPNICYVFGVNQNNNEFFIAVYDKEDEFYVSGSGAGVLSFDNEVTLQSEMNQSGECLATLTTPTVERNYDVIRLN